VRPAVDATARTVALAYRPWLAQRLVARCRAPKRVLVAARQVGKTHLAAVETLKVALARPGSVSVVLAPTRQFLRRAIDKILALAQGVPGVAWVEGRLRFELTNGSTIECVSAESANGEAIRGLRIDGVLWADEAALLPRHAFDAARACLLTSDGQVLLTTTPVGRNWVFQEYSSEDAGTARFRFRASDSPFTKADRLAECRRDYVPEKAAQELDARFVDEVGRPFPDTSRLFVKSFPDRSSEPRASLGNVIGVDLGDKQDFTVLTLVNRYGEVRLLDRWQRREWFESVTDIARYAHEHQALVVADHGAGAGAGTALKSELQRLGVRTALVQTAQLGVKKRIVEQAHLDVAWERVHVLAGGVHQGLADQLEHELTVFLSVTRVVRGQEHTVYEAPQVKGEHDDCVVSFCLALWGRAELAPNVGEDEDVSIEALVQQNERLAARLRAPGPGGAWIDLGNGTWVHPFADPPRSGL